VANGELVGYGGGLWRKRYLLNLESGQKTLLGAYFLILAEGKNLL